VSNLYTSNTLPGFWGVERDADDAVWLAAAAELLASDCLPGGRAVFDRGGWPALAEHVLGEGQFGAHHF